ncbi:MAG: hypothetical protein AB7T10_07880 [bacterium]
MNKTRIIFFLSLILSSSLLLFSQSSTGPEIFYPLSSKDCAPIENPLFIFKSSGVCTLKIVEVRDYYSKNEIYNSFPLYKSDVTDASYHYADYQFSEGVLYAWFIEGVNTDNGEAKEERSSCGYFKILSYSLQQKSDYRRHLVSLIFEESEEYKNAVEEGYSFNGSISINGIIPTNRELLEILNAIRTSKRIKTRVRQN